MSSPAAPGPRSALATTAARQSALAAEHAAVYGYGVVGANLTGSRQAAAMADWVAHLADLDICFGPVATVSEMLDDPQVHHRQMVLEIEDRKGERRRTLGNPIKLSATQSEIRLPPELGEHTDTVLTTLGYTDEEIVDLRTRGVV